MRRRAFSTCFTLLLALHSPGSLAGPELRLVAGDYPPYISATLPEQGPMSAEVMRLFRAIGYAPRLLPLVPWPRALLMVTAGQADASFGWGFSEHRQTDFISSRPFFRVPRKLFAPAGHKPIIELDDVAGRSLCMPRGYTLPPEIEALLQQRPLRLERPADGLGCLKMMAAGRVDYFFQAEPVGLLLIEQAGLGGQIRAASNAIGHADFHILLPRYRSDSAVIVQRLNEAIAAGR